MVEIDCSDRAAVPEQRSRGRSADGCFEDAQDVPAATVVRAKKGNQWHQGMKAHIGVEADSGIVHSLISTAAKVYDVTQAGELLHGEETHAFGDAGYRGVSKREEVQGSLWHIAMTPGKRKQLSDSPLDQMLEKVEKIKAGIRANVEHPFAPSMGFVLQMGAIPTLQPGQATVILDRIQDPGNAGTILRSAAAFGFGQVVSLKGAVALWSPKVLRPGMGAHFSLHLVEGLEAHALAELAMPLLLSSPHAATALHQANLPWPCAWVMGHEG